MHCNDLRTVSKKTQKKVVTTRDALFMHYNDINQMPPVYGMATTKAAKCTGTSTLTRNDSRACVTSKLPQDSERLSHSAIALSDLIVLYPLFAGQHRHIII